MTIDEILGNFDTGLDEDQRRALRAHWGALDVEDGLEGRSLAIYEALEYDAPHEVADDVVEDLEEWVDSLEQVEDTGVIDQELAEDVAALAGVPAIVVDVVFAAANEVCDVCVKER
jgi:hypothetical protein